MNYCQHCGHQLKEKDNFCQYCGKQVATPQSELMKKTESISLKERFNKLSRKQRIIGGSVFVAIILLFSFYQIGRTYADPERVIGEFEQAVEEEDREAIADLLVFDDGEEIDSEDLDGFMRYLDEGNISSTDIQNLLTDQIENPAADYILSVEESDGNWFSFNRYDIVVPNFYVEATVERPGSDVLFEQEVISTTESERETVELGPLVPGIYQMEATFENDFAYLSEYKEFELLRLDRTDVDLSFYLEGDTLGYSVEYESEAEDIQYYLNDQEIELDADNLFSPVSADQQLETFAVLTFPWGEVETETTEVRAGNNYLSVDSPFSEEAKNELIDAVDQYGTEYINVMNEQSVDEASVVTDAFSDDYLTDEVDGLIDSERYWDSDHSETNIDLSSLSLSYDEDDAAYYVNVNVEYVFLVDEVTDPDEFGDSEPSEETRRMQLRLFYDESKDAWLVDDVSGLFFFSSSNLEEISH